MKLLPTSFLRASARLLSRTSKRLSSTLVVGEHDGHHLSEASLKAVQAASQFGNEVSVVIAVEKFDKELYENLKGLKAVQKIFIAEDECYKGLLAESIAPLLVELQEKRKYSQIVAAADAFGRNLIPRLAAMLDISPVSDVIDIKSNDTFVRPIYAGNAIQTVKCHEPVKVLTVRPTSFSLPEDDGSTCDLEQLDIKIKNNLSEWVREEIHKSERPELTTAKIVVSGGRGLKSAENFEKIIFPLADKLGAGVGASRAAVDSGFVPNDMQVGQTGKIVAPGTYIAIGISGAIQHLAGMKDSKVIVAVNKDSEAPIFQVADHGIVGDLFKVVPEMTKLLD